MTQATLKVTPLEKVMIEDVKCDYKPEDTPWKANLAGNSETLGDNLGNKPNAGSVAELSRTQWPSQAHHLIPHLTLKDHAVAKWLKEGSILFADTKYNVDHENNGKWMPYASSLPEWQTYNAAQKRQLMFDIMELAQIQMHQGPHSKKNRYGIGEAPYKERVTQYLEKIKNHGVSHYVGANKCDDCNSKKQANKYPPRNNTVKYVDLASGYIEDDINKCKIFVSRIAAEFAETVGFD